MSLYWLLLGILSVWRLSHLVSEEDGPWDLLFRMRRKLGQGFWGSLLDCFYCVSLWISAPAGYWIGTGWSERVLLWLSFSARATLLQECVCAGDRPTTIHVEEKESNNVLLRPETPSHPPKTTQP